MVNVTNFEFFTLEPNIATDNRMAISNISGNPTVVAELNLSEDYKGDQIWINGVVGVDNDDRCKPAWLIFRIYKGEPFIPGREIYLAEKELDREGDGDVVNVPISHVDVIQNNETNVKYVLTVESDISNSFVDGPITFAAITIKS